MSPTAKPLQFHVMNDRPDTDHQSGDDQVDRALLRRIAVERDRAALQVLYGRYLPRVTGFLRRMTNDSGMVEEAYNDVMLTVWNKAGQYREESKASSWIFSIAYRVCLRMVKKHKFRAGVLEMLGKEVSASTRSSSDGVDQRDLIRAALEKLSAAHRLVVELSYYREFSTEEIAVIADCPVNTVKTRLFHARKKIRAFVDEQTQGAAA